MTNQWKASVRGLPVRWNIQDAGCQFGQYRNHLYALLIHRYETRSNVAFRISFEFRRDCGSAVFTRDTFWADGFVMQVCYCPPGERMLSNSPGLKVSRGKL